MDQKNMKTVSMTVVRRVPRYYHQICQLEKQGILRISSGALAERMGLTASQIRQDFNCFGGFGQQGYGYQVTSLKHELEKILCLDQGHSAILVDQRAHAQSEGKYLSFGINESRDCLAWIDYVNQSFGTDRKIIIEGVSMGAATVLMAAGLELPENVIGVLADSGYSSPERIIRAVMRQRHFPQFLFPFLRLGGILFGGFDICSGSPVEALKSCKVPVFFIHGDEDRFVPYAMGQENYEACPGKKFFFTGKNAGHGLSYLIDREGYRKAHREFMDEIL